jgi:hypothetical protein
MKLHSALAAMAIITLCLSTKLRGQEAQSSFAHVSNSFTLVVHAPYQVTAPLFGPNGERSWSEGEDWDPQFFYPQPGIDVPGAVFAIQHGSKRNIWVNTVFDIAARHFQYVYFVPEVMVTTIDVHFAPIDARNTKVTVVYTRTALDSAANEHVRELGDQDRKSGEHWERAINDSLKKHKP